MNKKKTLDIILIAAFVAIILLPVASMVFRFAPVDPEAEKRSFDEFPRLKADFATVTTYHIALGKYFEKHFGFHDQLSEAYKFIKKEVLHDFDNRGIVYGKDGWLYWAGDGEIEMFRVLEPFTETELRRYARILRERQAYCEEKGIRYIFVITPNKTSIYPEYLPDWIKPTRDRTYLDQLVEYVGRGPAGNCFLDVRPALRKAKSENHQVYYRLDTHWTNFGAFTGYQEIMKHPSMFPGLRPYPLADFTETPTVKADCDIPFFIKKPMTEKTVTLVPRISRRAVTVFNSSAADKPTGPDSAFYQSRTSISRSIMIHENRGSGLPRMVMFRDSMAIALAPFMSEHFSRSAYSWDYFSHDFDIEMIEYEKPQVVITEQGERFLKRLSENPIPVRQAYLRRAFASLSPVPFLGERSETKMFRARGGTELAAGREGIVFRNTGADVSFEIHPRTPDGTSPVLRLEITAAAKTALKIERPERLNAGPDVNFSIPLKEGPNVVYLDLEDLKADRFMLVSAAAGSKGLTVRNIELRRKN